MKLNLNELDQDIILFCAFRYALGRHTYVVGTIVNVITNNWEYIPQSRREMFKKEIREYYEHPHMRWDENSRDYDKDEWEKILKLPDDQE